MLDEQLAVRFGVQSPRLVTARLTASVYRGLLGDAPVAVKVYADAGAFAREADCLRCLGDAVASVPRLLDCGTVEGVSVIVQEWREGWPADAVVATLTRERRVALLGEAGRLLAELDFALSPAHLAGAQFWRRPGVDVLGRLSWRAYLLALLDKWLGRIRLTPADAVLGLDQRLREVRAATSRLPEPPRLTLLHNDYTFRNLLLTPDHGGLCGIIDFAGAGAGDPFWDLAKLTWVELDIDDTEGQRPFLAGWEALTRLAIDRERLAVHQALETVGCLAWVDKQTNAGDEHAAFRRRAALTLARLGPRLPR